MIVEWNDTRWRQTEDPYLHEQRIELSNGGRHTRESKFWCDIQRTYHTHRGASMLLVELLYSSFSGNMAFPCSIQHPLVSCYLDKLFSSVSRKKKMSITGLREGSVEAHMWSLSHVKGHIAAKYMSSIKFNNNLWRMLLEPYDSCISLMRCILLL